MILNIDHIGVAVRSIAEAKKYYEEALGLTCQRIEDVPSQKVRTAFFDVGGTHIELLEATAPDSPIAGFLEKRGEGVHHVAFATDDIAAQLADAKNAGVRLIHEIPIEGAADKLVAFLHPKSTFGVLTEVCAPKPKDAPAN